MALRGQRSTRRTTKLHLGERVPAGHFDETEALVECLRIAGAQKDDACVAPEWMIERQPHQRLTYAASPTLVTEFGVPSSLGSAHNSPLAKRASDHLPLVAVVDRV